MTSRLRPTVRRLPTIAVLLGASLLLAAGLGPAETVFFAGFDEPQTSSPGTSTFLEVFGGEALFRGPDAVLEVVTDLEGEGFLQVGENASGAEAALDCVLDEVFEGTACDIGFSLQRFGLGDLGFHAEDDDGGQVIDLTFEDDGDVTVKVAGVPTTVGIPAAMLDVALNVKLALRDPLVAPCSWALTISNSKGTVKASGALGPGLSVASMHITRPAGVLAALDHLDDLSLTIPTSFGSLASGVRP